jgi:hypothetical protein
MRRWKKEQIKTRADVARLEIQIAEIRAASLRSPKNKKILDNAAVPPAAATRAAGRGASEQTD